MERFIERLDSDYVKQDIAAIQIMIDQLKERANGEYIPEPEGHDGIVTQALEAPNFNVAFEEALPSFGFDAITRYEVGGEGDRTMLWASSSASAEHIDKARSLGVARFHHPLDHMLSYASGGEFYIHLSYGGKLQIDHKDIPNDELDLTCRAFMLSHLVAHIRNYKIWQRHVDLYDKFREADITPLGFEEIGGLALSVLRDTIKVNPDLAP